MRLQVWNSHDITTVCLWNRFPAKARPWA